MRARALIGLVVLAGVAVAVHSARLHARSQAPALTLQGTLMVGEFFGPPGYGENATTDRRERQQYLQLPALAATQDANFFKLDRELRDKDTYFVQIVILDDSLRARSSRLVGQRVEVVGTPFPARTGHHRTGLLLEVTKVRSIKDWKW